MSHWVSIWGQAHTKLRLFTPGFDSNTMLLAIPSQLNGKRLRLRFSNREGTNPYGIVKGTVRINNEAYGWISEELMIKIAMENNFSETAFTVKKGDHYHLRWFTPGGEIDLCGHATLATAFVLFRFYEKDASSLTFDTLSGPLIVSRVISAEHGSLLSMDFPAYTMKKVMVTDAMEEALGVRPLEAYMGRDLLCVLKNEEQVTALKPDMDKLKKLNGLLLHATARTKNGSEYQCVSRSFAPKLNVKEDPVCGSGHCHIVPYWANRFGLKEFTAFQASSRGGILYCRMGEGRVTLAGKAALYSACDLVLEGI
ncbi:MAG: PhzF family phenazine biosynthesis protein [Eubacterium sp.]|nr:PhzF family phenazine biosynthesis protein [Eubacterium sp.]